MKEIESILSRLDQRDDLDDIRQTIADLIEQHLVRNKASLGYWELAHFTNAIGSLAMNVNSPSQPTYGGLRLCLYDLEKALTAHTVERTDYDAIRQMAAPISSSMLLETLATIRAQIIRSAHASFV